MTSWFFCGRGRGPHAEGLVVVSDDVERRPEGPREHWEELERRRREHASPAQKVVEEFMMERLDSTTEHLPSKGHVTRLSLREIMVAIDDAVRKGETIPYPEYVGYWRRWIAARWYWNCSRGRVRARRCRG